MIKGMIVAHTHMCTHTHTRTVVAYFCLCMCILNNIDLLAEGDVVRTTTKKAVKSVSSICKRLFTGIYPASNVCNTNKTSGLTQIHISSVFVVILIGVICTRRETCLFI